jgi:acyl carrier protein
MINLGDRIQDFLENTLLIRGIEKDTALIDGGYIDSIQILELAMFIEETFEVTLVADDMEVENFASIDAMVSYVSQKRKLIS